MAQAVSAHTKRRIATPPAIIAQPMRPMISACGPAGSSADCSPAQPGRREASSAATRSPRRRGVVSKIDPSSVAVARFHAGLDEGDALHAVLDGGEEYLRIGP